ncbi:MAG: hypothetical protein ACYC0X_11720 [Pirellulaceae bacterium]
MRLLVLCYVEWLRLGQQQPYFPWLFFQGLLKVGVHLPEIGKRDVA